MAYNERVMEAYKLAKLCKELYDALDDCATDIDRRINSGQRIHSELSARASRLLDREKYRIEGIIEIGHLYKQHDYKGAYDNATSLLVYYPYDKTIITLQEGANTGIKSFQLTHVISQYGI